MLVMTGKAGSLVGLPVSKYLIHLQNIYISNFDPIFGLSMIHSLSYVVYIVWTFNLSVSSYHYIISTIVCTIIITGDIEDL